MEWALHLSACSQISLMDSSFPLDLPRGCARFRVQHPLVVSFLQLQPELTMLMILSLEVKASFEKLCLLLLELTPLIQELPMHLSISILRCCSHLNFRSPSNALLLEVKPCVCHFCLQLGLHTSQMRGEANLLLLHKVVEVLFSLQGEICLKRSCNLFQLSPLCVAAS